MTTGFAMLALDLLGRAGASRSFKAELGSAFEMEGVAHELELLGCDVTQDPTRCLITVSASVARVEAVKPGRETECIPGPAKKWRIL